MCFTWKEVPQRKNNVDVYAETEFGRYAIRLVRRPRFRRTWDYKLFIDDRHYATFATLLAAVIHCEARKPKLSGRLTQPRQGVQNTPATMQVPE